jgi:hypothetical protein
MRQPDDGGLETERPGLRRRRVFEFSGDQKTAGDAAFVEVSDVMQTARSTGASIGQRRDDDIGLDGDRL